MISKCPCRELLMLYLTGIVRLNGGNINPSTARKEVRASPQHASASGPSVSMETVAIIAVH